MKLNVPAQKISRYLFWRQLSKEAEICAASGLFDSIWYLERNPDVAAAGMDPVSHYVRMGAGEGRDPNPLFDTDWYLEQNPDVAAAGINPLAHYIRWGAYEGRDPNPFFDTDWYLQQNADVAAAGINSLVHYIRWGSAKGLDPSPVFHGVWYLQHYPDVAAAGLNPLAHYIQWGAAELRQPVSPIPRFLEKVSGKPRRCAEEMRRIVETYSLPPDIPPQKAMGDNNSQVGVSWAEHFMWNGVEHYRAGDLQRALESAKRAFQILPFEADPLDFYCSLFLQCNRQAIEHFTKSFSDAELLVVHISHRGGLSRAEQSCRSFFDPRGQIGNLIVVGNEELGADNFVFDPSKSVLYVPTRDVYEALPQKVAKTILCVGLCPLNLPVLKVDDDTLCMDLEALKKLLYGEISKHAYGGYINPHTNSDTCSFWHFGKCTDKEIDVRPDGLISNSPYAGGPGYWLNATAVNILSRLALIHERHIEVEFFEDRAIGSALGHYGIGPHHCDLVTAGVLRDAGRPPVTGKPARVRLRGARPEQEMPLRMSRTVQPSD